MNNQNRLKMQNIPGTPPKRKSIEEQNYNKYLNNTNNNLINPFNTDLEKLLIFCSQLLDSIKNKNLFNNFAFSGSFAVYLYKYHLKYNFSNLDLNMNSWKPKDIDIIVDKNISQLRKGMSEIARSSFVKMEFGQNAIVTGTEQIIQYNEYINGYKIVKIDLVPESAGKGNLEKICHLKFVINDIEYKLPLLPFEKILETKREQLEGYPSTSANEKIINKHNRVQKHIKNLEMIDMMKNDLKNINCKNKNNSSNNNSLQNNSRQLNFNNNNSSQNNSRRLNFNNNNSLQNNSRQLNFNNNNNDNSFIRRNTEMRIDELNNSSQGSSSQNQRQGRRQNESPLKRPRLLGKKLFE